MSEAGYAAQVVKVTETHTYQLDEKELAEVLMQPEIQDLPIVVVSVAGAYRGGKSFLLNFFLRYLISSPSARADGSWLHGENEALTGFSWRGGSKRNTTGILLWSEPFITLLANGDKVAVILMDTQGTFDSSSTVRDCSTIFALSTLLSSVQIYNISTNIQEDDLQHLQLFTEYGRLVKEKGANAFQVLEFLVRDWPYPDEYPYGAVGGQLLLQERLEIGHNMPKELQELREHIHSSFEKISCYLMPHPGFKVQSLKFSGSIKDIEPEFLEHLKKLVSSLFGSDKLLPKTINGERVNARELFTYFKSYMDFFNSDKIPTPRNIMKATAEAIMLSAILEAKNLYETGMDNECGSAQPSVPAGDLEDLHQKYKAIALNAFTSKKKMGSKEESDKYLEKLTMELENRLPQFMQSNMSKIQTAINEAKDAYDQAIRNISEGQPLCVHPLDLQQVHNEGVAVAIKLFDAGRKKISSKQDKERDAFISSFEKQYQLLRLTNEQNNKMIIQDLRMAYWEHMRLQCNFDPPLSDNDFRSEHERTLSKALENFKIRRNRPDSYTEDVFKYDMIKTITDNFVNLKKINKSKNKAAFKKAEDKYNKFIEEHLEGLRKCLHPKDLQHVHEAAKCRALVEFRPRRQCSSGFDISDEDERTLMEILEQRYIELKNINETANEAAVQAALNVYISMMDDLCRPTLCWLLIIPIFVFLANKGKYHDKSKTAAIEVFYGKRRSGSYHSWDPYLDYLDSMINEAYKHYDLSMRVALSMRVHVNIGG